MLELQNIYEAKVQALKLPPKKKCKEIEVKIQ